MRNLSVTLQGIITNKFRFYKRRWSHDGTLLLYFEELDWSLRAKKKGYRLSVALDSVVFHKEGASIGTSSKNTRSLLSEYYLSRNLIMCYRHLLPIFSPSHCFEI